jgi:hypothetical protein
MPAVVAAGRAGEVPVQGEVAGEVVKHHLGAGRAGGGGYVTGRLVSSMGRSGSAWARSGLLDP